MALHLHRSHFDIFTWRFNQFNVIANSGQIRGQSFRRTYERTALPHSFPGC